MNYQQAIRYVENMEKAGMKLGLATVKELLARLNNPQDDLKVLHIAGTNGKGSTSCFLTNILVESGYRVGTFNSPSVFGYNEKILFNAVPISNGDAAKYLSAVKTAVDKMQQEGLNIPSAFEIEFAAALLYFKDMKCDFAVLECGLGGKDDATNAIDNKVLAIITSISFDHTAILGNTLKDIAQNKFAIVKNCPLVTYDQGDEIMGVLSKAGRLLLCDTPLSLSSGANGQTMQYKGETYCLRQLGKYQLTNCSLAIESALYLSSQGYSITPQSIKAGVAKSLWKGRLQKLAVGGKTFLLDGMHNEGGAKELAEELKSHFSDMKKCFVFGMFKDKDSDKVLQYIGSLADRFITVTPPTERGLNGKILAQKCMRYTDRCTYCGSMQSAIDKAYDGEEELVVVCGSLSILSDALRCINAIIPRLSE